MSKVLVTGGAGYLGSVLVPLLLEKGHSVTVADSFVYRQSSLLPLCLNQNFNVVNGDVRDESVIERCVDGVDFIIPLAALVGYPLCENKKFDAVSTNLDAIKLLLKKRKNNQKIIFPCTNSGYGTGREEVVYTEESALKPISLYGKTKVEAEKLIIKDGNSISFRFATLFGASARMRTDLLVNDFVYRAVFDRSVVVYQGNFVRNYLHVSDAARAFCFAIDNFEKMKGNSYNCGLKDANLTKLELCCKIKEHIPNFNFVEAAYGEDPDKRNYNVSNDKIEKAGFFPTVTLDDGIEELIKAYKIIKKSQYGNY